MICETAAVRKPQFLEPLQSVSVPEGKPAAAEVLVHG
jgi:hypothetical protein